MLSFSASATGGTGIRTQVWITPWAGPGRVALFPQARKHPPKLLGIQAKSCIPAAVLLSSWSLCPPVPSPGKWCSSFTAAQQMPPPGSPPPPSQAPLESNPLPSQPESQASPSHLSPARPGSSGCPRIILTPLPGALPCSWTCSITSFCPYTIIRHLQYASPLQETQTGERSQNPLSSLGKLH